MNDDDVTVMCCRLVNTLRCAHAVDVYNTISHSVVVADKCVYVIVGNVND